MGSEKSNPSWTNSSKSWRRQTVLWPHWAASEDREGHGGGQNGLQPRTRVHSPQVWEFASWKGCNFKDNNEEILRKFKTVPTVL